MSLRSRITLLRFARVLPVELDLTGGGYQPQEDGSRLYYAGEAGDQTLTARAMDSHGFPSAVSVEVTVAEGTR